MLFLSWVITRKSSCGSSVMVTEVEGSMTPVSSDMEEMVIVGCVLVRKEPLRPMGGMVYLREGGGRVEGGGREREGGKRSI